MPQISRFVIWICKKFNREEIVNIIEQLIDILENRNPDVIPRDDFKEKHPNYRDFKVDPLQPLSEPPENIISAQQNYQILLKQYQEKNGKILKPVNVRSASQAVPEYICCSNCEAPHQYIYFNNGKKRSQFKCKVCGITFHVKNRFLRTIKYFCPYCFKALFAWKKRDEVTIYKCGNDHCSQDQRAQQVKPK